MEVKVKYHNPMCEISKIDNGDWIDLRCPKDVTIKNGEFKLIPLGISMELPDGKEAHVVPRSSTFKNFGIIMTNHKGIIDNSYNGDNDIWHFPALCLGGKVELVKPNIVQKVLERFIPQLAWFRYGTIIGEGDRICQFKIVDKMEDVNFVEVKSLGNKDRGGIGSTGVK